MLSQRTRLLGGRTFPFTSICFPKSHVCARVPLGFCPPEYDQWQVSDVSTDDDEAVNMGVHALPRAQGSYINAPECETAAAASLHLHSGLVFHTHTYPNIYLEELSINVLFLLSGYAKHVEKLSDVSTKHYRKCCLLTVVSLR